MNKIHANYLLIACSLFGLVQTSHASFNLSDLNKPTGIMASYDDYLETINHDEKYVARKMAVITPFYESKKAIKPNVTLNHYGDLSLALGQYKGGDIDKPDYLFDKTYTESMVGTKQRYTFAYNAHQVVPQLGLEGSVNYKSNNHRWDYGVSGVTGLSYNQDDNQYGILYKKDLLHKYKYRDFVLDQTGDEVSVFAQKPKKNKIMGVTMGYRFADKGDAKYIKNIGYYEPKSRQYTIGLYAKY